MSALLTMPSDTLLVTVPALPPQPGWAEERVDEGLEHSDFPCFTWRRTLASVAGPVIVEQFLNGLPDGRFTISTPYLLVDGYWELTAEECQALAVTIGQAATIVQQATDAALALVNGRAS